MKVNMNRSLILVFGMIFSLSLVSACGSSKKKVIESYTEDGVTVTAYGSKGHFKKGNNSFILKFKKDGKPFDAGKNVKFNFHMVAMPPNMPPMTNDITISPTKKLGVYKGEGKLQMSGNWTVNIEYGDGKTMAFSISARK